MTKLPQILKSLVIVFVMFCCPTYFFMPAFATSGLDEATLDFYDANNILYYDPCAGSGNSNTGGVGTASGNSNEAKIWNWFASANIPGVSDNPAVIAGIMGNLQQEHGFQTDYNNRSATPYGIAQWTGNRKTAVLATIPEGASEDEALVKQLEYLTSEPQFQEFVSELSNVVNTSGETGAGSYADLFLVIVEGAYAIPQTPVSNLKNGTTNILEDSYVQTLGNKRGHTYWQEAEQRRIYATAIYQKYANSTSSSMGQSAGTGDYNAVLNAKNANKQATDFPPIELNGTENIKITLENYGDLAYQLGRAVGVPWISVIVQAQWEDPDPAKQCGKNNFWGNGCPPGTPVGGAKIQGKNLGEGFKQYGETLTNGYHDQALGETDPIVFLEKIGPTWVQGNINGDGYSNIEGMKKHVKAIQDFINTPEGQAIVQTFGSYSANNTSSNSCDTSTGVGATNIGEAANIPVADRMAYLFPDGAPTTKAQADPYMTRITIPILDENGQQTTKEITTHVKLATEVTAAFQDMVNAGFRVRQSDSYNFRQNVNNPGKLSKHSYGAAVDLNWDVNPNTTNFSIYQPNSTDPFKVNDNIVRIWRNHGFFWGGCFGSVADIMHFDYIDKGRSDRYTVCNEQ